MWRGEAVALVVEGGGGEAVAGEEDGGELEEPAGLGGEAVDEGDNVDDGAEGNGANHGEELYGRGWCQGWWLPARRWWVVGFFLM